MGGSLLVNGDFTLINNTSTTLTIAPALDDDDDDFTSAAKIDGGSSTAGTTTMVMEEETKSPSVAVNQTGHHHGLHHLHVPKLKKLILSDEVEEKILLECQGALK